MASFLSMGLTGTGSIITATAQLQGGREAEAEGKTAQNIMNYNATVKRQNAAALKAATTFNQIRQVKGAERLGSTMLSRAGASGARVDVGAPVAAFAEQAEESELDMLLMGYESGIKQQQIEMGAQFDIMQGGIYKAKGKAARKASYWQAASTILTGFGGAASQWPQKQGAAQDDTMIGF